MKIQRILLGTVLVLYATMGLLTARRLFGLERRTNGLRRALQQTQRNVDKVVVLLDAVK